MITEGPTPARLQPIGLLGGWSREPSALYHRLLNGAVHRKLGGHHNARSVHRPGRAADNYIANSVFSRQEPALLGNGDTSAAIEKAHPIAETTQSAESKRNGDVVAGQRAAAKAS